MAAEAACRVAMEFEGMDLGDERLNRRAVKLAGGEAGGEAIGEHRSGLRRLGRDSGGI